MTDLNTAEVTWDAHAIAQDSSDPDSLPEQIPLQGIRVTLTPSPRKVEVAQGQIDGWPARTVILRDWVLDTGPDGILRNPEDPSNPVPVLIVASDAIPGTTIEWTSRISAPDTGVPDIIKTWLAPAGAIVDLTSVDSVPGTGGSNLAQYLQAVADARAAAQNAVDAAESAGTSAYQAQAAREGAESHAESASDSADRAEGEYDKLADLFLEGSEAVNDAAVASYVETEGTETSTALQSSINEGLDRIGSKFLAPLVQVNSALTGQTLYGYGSSTVADPYGYIAYVRNEMGPDSYVNRGENGWHAQDIVGGAVREDTDTRTRSSRQGGIVVADVLRNNLISEDTPRNRATALEAARAICAVLSSTGRIEQTEGTSGGGFVTINNTQPYASGGSIATWSVPGRYMEIPVPEGTSYLLLHGTNGENARGGIAVVSQEGSEISRLNTDGLTRNTGRLITNGVSPVVMNLPHLKEGVIRVDVEQLPEMDRPIRVDAVLPQLTQGAPMIVLVKPLPVTAETHSNPTMLDYLRSIPETLSAEFPNIYVLDMIDGWDMEAMLLEDGLHANGLGKHYQKERLQELLLVEPLRRKRAQMWNGYA